MAIFKASISKIVFFKSLLIAQVMNPQQISFTFYTIFQALLLVNCPYEGIGIGSFSPSYPLKDAPLSQSWNISVSALAFFALHSPVQCLTLLRTE